MIPLGRGDARPLFDQSNVRVPYPAIHYLQVRVASVDRNVQSGPSSAVWS